MKRNNAIIKTAVIGYGYWGPNLVRNFSETENTSVIYCCDLNEERLKQVKNKYPSIIVTKNYNRILSDPQINAVIIATPLSSHYTLAKKALEAGKHVWIEKPMTQKSEEASSLISLSKKKNRIIFVDHVFVYTEAISTIKKIINSNYLGTIYFFDSVRINLGLFQPDTNVLWDLAPHDISIMSYLLDKDPEYVSVFANSHITSGLEDTAYISFRFKTKMSAHVHVSWLSPVKIRRSIIAGSKKMIVYDDLQTAESVKVYNRGIVRKSKLDESISIPSTMGYQYRIGDILVPAIEIKEGLRTAVKHFTDCIRKSTQPLTNGEEGLKIVKIIEAADKSIKENGRFIKI